MKIAAVILLVLSGSLISYFLVKESYRRVENASKMYDFASYLEERIVFAREPLPSILSSYQGGDELFCKLENGASETSKLAEGICCGTYEIASVNASLIKKCAEKEMNMMKKDHSEMKKAKIVLPLAASFLAAILLI